MPTQLPAPPVLPATPRPPDDVAPWRIYAVKYAEREARRPDHFLGGDPHDEPMPMDYFIWVVTRAGEHGPQTWVIDTGFGPDDAAQRNRRLLRTAAEGLATVGVDATTVEDVILTHLHYDHVGGFDQFPAARFHLQDREMAFATGRDMTHRAIGHAFTADHIAGMVHLVFDQRVVFGHGDHELAPGLSVHLVPGHTMGLQVVRVATEVGWVVLASDASHFYENMDSGRPFPIAWNVAGMLDGHRRCRQLASAPELVVPGHDPRVFERYPAAGDGVDGVAVRLDGLPTSG